MELYPLKFKPFFSYRIWGGEKLKAELNKKYDTDSIGESWEISDIEGSETVVAEGALKGKTLKNLIKKFKNEFLGNEAYKAFGNNFPLLIKFIDAKSPLSIQVHPNNTLAKERHNSFGKNEMWYVMQSEEDAEVIVGFNQNLEKESYLKSLKNRTLKHVLNIENVKRGDTFYIPAGRVHSIGAGVMLAEIQQTSDITYRIYDYDRIDKKTGAKRELHNDLAIDAIDFKFHETYKTFYDEVSNDTSKLVHSPYFKTNIINISGRIKKDYTTLDSFVIFMCVEGKLEIEWKGKIFGMNKGETLLIPANIKLLNIIAVKAKLLEVYL